MVWLSEISCAARPPILRPSKGQNLTTTKTNDVTHGSAKVIHVRRQTVITVEDATNPGHDVKYGEGTNSAENDMVSDGDK